MACLGKIMIVPGNPKHGHDRTTQGGLTLTSQHHGRNGLVHCKERAGKQAGLLTACHT